MSGRLLLRLGAAFCALGLSACGGSGSVTPKFVNSGIVTTAVRFSDHAIARFIEPTAPAATFPSRVSTVGQTSGTSIESLQYFIQSIQLCESVTMNGSGYSGTSGCTNLYENPDAATREVSYYNTYSLTEAKADTNENHFVDFMTEAGRAKLQATGSIDTGTFNYALINFQRPIKIKATFNAAGSTTPLYYTKATTTVLNAGTDDGGREIELARTAASNSGSAELMTYMLNNGGTVVPLAKSVTIESSDSIFLDFVFNSDSFATASVNTGCNISAVDASAKNNPAMDANCVSFNLPYAKMSPVVRKAGEQTRKEVYLITNYNVTAGAEASARIELYYNSADATKSIRGIDTAVIMKSTATQGVVNTISSYKAEETGDVVKLIGWNPLTNQMDGVSVSNLTRRANGTLKLGCYFTGGPCATADGSKVDLAYTYQGDAVVSQ